ncbi:MAG: M16 family metallopeptidase [Flavobacteriales bacterium]
MNFQRLGLLSAGLLMSLLAAAQTPQIAFEEYDLKNGMHVILHEDHSTPIVAVTIMYHVGSKNEDPNRTGMAHFFEHLLFEGSENIGRGEFSRYVENAGGVLNANTTNDRTFYYELLPSNQLELGLWLESERMLHAKVDIDGIETQREVVKEEKRLRVDNQPYGNLIAETMDRAYSEHPYRWTTIGSMEHLDAAQAEEFQAFYKKFYVPNNATLSIAGDIDVAETKKLIQKYFGGIPTGKVDIPRPVNNEPMNPGEVRDTIMGDDQLPLVLQAYRIPEMDSEDYYAVDMLNRILSTGESSRLNRSLVQDQELAMFAGAFSFGLEDPGLTLGFVMCNMGVDPLDVEQAFDTEVERVRTELVSEREFEKVRNQIENDFVSSNSRLAGIAESLANYHVFYGNTSLINSEIEKYMAVTRDDLLRVAQKYYVNDNRVVLYFLYDENTNE